MPPVEQGHHRGAARRPGWSREAWAREGQDAVRGFAGGLLFGVPLLFTMEVWWLGETAGVDALLPVLAATAVPVFLLVRTAGFRRSRDVALSDSLQDTAEAMAIGLLASGFVLVLLREIAPGTSVSSALGKAVVESLPFALGVALAREFLVGSRTEAAGDRGADGAGREGGGSAEQGTISATAADLGATLIGATFIAASIAPTQEIPMLVAQMSAAWLLVVVLASLLVSYLIVFTAGLGDVEKRRAQRGLLQRPLPETLASYAASLFVAFVLLVTFDNTGGYDLAAILPRVVVLGLPASVGGAAGRLAV